MNMNITDEYMHASKDVNKVSWSSGCILSPKVDLWATLNNRTSREPSNNKSNNNFDTMSTRMSMYLNNQRLF